MSIDRTTIPQMNKARFHKIVRKAHRYVGVLLGVQFLFWTVGGLYFSWTNIKEIRGEDIRKEEPALLVNGNYVSLDSILTEVKKKDTIHYLKSVQLIDLLGQSYYQVSFHNTQRIKTVLANAVTGAFKQPLTAAEAIAVAQSRLKNPEEPVSVKYIAETNGHHEYREKPLPAYAVTFKGNINSTVYVSTEMGTVQSLRNNRWRVFDFLWMLHTMDYNERDNINNWALRLFSVFGLLVILSGFSLYLITIKRRKKRNTKTI